ncbi:MAG: HEPN domain-containing protein [Bacteroidota bacterium]|nr:HEPN domain-containing protein [Bacteroidota bacterium]
MTLSAQEKIDLSQYRFEKARKLLDDSRSLLDAGSFESSVNRSYYAILAASRAVLILRGIDAETHEGVKTMLSKEFIKTGKLPKHFGEIFRTVQARRVDSDYGDYTEIGHHEALDSLNRAEEFLGKIGEVLETMIKS